MIQFATGADLPRLAAAFDRALAHRGPDDRNAFIAPDASVLLVHRRLAIIDPSAAARQPMVSPDGRYYLLFNGEVYNHHALRASLAADHEPFVTQSDTEVLLRLLMRRGMPALADVRGMFALALWDSEARTVTIARDRFGIKPLYVAASRRRVAFASEVRALVDAGVSDAAPDPAGVLAFLRWGHVPSPMTWIRGIEAVPPGTWMRWQGDGSSTRGTFADPAAMWAGPADVPDEATFVERTRSALDDSVSAHLVADVPVGVFLSGGLDSAVLTALARPHVTRLHTYTVSVDDPAFDEAGNAAQIARRFDTTHHTLRVDAADIARTIETALHAMDQPTVDGFNTFAVSGAVAQTGVKAVLSGVGGDELFGGYPSFHRLPRAVRFAQTLPPAVPLAAMIAARRAPRWQAPRWAHFAAHHDSVGETYRALRGYFMPSELAAVLGPQLKDDREALERVACVEAAQLRDVPGEAIVATAARLESTVYMRSQLLRDIDAFSMAHSLEVRVPFVDAPLLSSIWPAIAAKPTWLEHKALLAAAVPELPLGYSRQPKRGFTLPFEVWIDGDLHDFVRAGLRELADAGWIAPHSPQRLLNDWTRRTVHWSRIWGLGVFGNFLQQRLRRPQEAT